MRACAQKETSLGRVICLLAADSSMETFLKVLWTKVMVAYGEVGR